MARRETSFHWINLENLPIKTNTVIAKISASECRKYISSDT